MPKYVINGKEYHSLEEIPEEFRHFVEDKNGDGIPDFIQQAGTSSQVESVTVESTEYNSLDELPDELRGQVESQLGVDSSFHRDDVADSVSSP